MINRNFYAIIILIVFSLTVIPTAYSQTVSIEDRVANLSSIVSELWTEYREIAGQEFRTPHERINSMDQHIDLLETDFDENNWLVGDDINNLNQRIIQLENNTQFPTPSPPAPTIDYEERIIELETLTQTLIGNNLDQQSKINGLVTSQISTLNRINYLESTIISLTGNFTNSNERINVLETNLESTWRDLQGEIWLEYSIEMIREHSPKTFSRIIANDYELEIRVRDMTIGDMLETSIEIVQEYIDRRLQFDPDVTDLINDKNALIKHKAQLPYFLQ